MRQVVAVALLLGCSGKDEDPGPTTPVGDDDDDDDDAAANDQDGDGYIPPGDCDDTDPLVYPGAEDVLYDGVDSDCAGDSDFDADLDGYDSDAYGGPDCDDDDPIVNPDGTERCNGVDDDCNGQVDGGDAEDASNWWPDLDGDGHGDPNGLLQDCDPPAGTVDVGDDCDDTQPTVFPAAPAIPCDGLDNDCDPGSFEAGAVTLDSAPAADLAAALRDSTAGSVIELCEGRYAVSDVVVPRSLTIRGTGGSALTELDAGGAGAVVTVFSTAPVALEGLTLTGGTGRTLGLVVAGGGLLVGSAADVTATDLVVTGNQAEYGGGVYVGASGRLTLVDSSVTGNTGSGAGVSSGGGLYTEDDAVVTLTTSWFSSNTADQCGGGWLGTAAIVSGDGASGFDANEAVSLAGGGVCAIDGGTLLDVEVSNNVSANVAGGIDGVDVLLDGVVVRANTSTLDGGGLTVYGQVDIVDCTITDNVADFDGGAIETAFASTRIVVRDSVVHANEGLLVFPPAIGGGARLALGATLESVNTDWGTGVTDNLPGDVGLDADDSTWSWAGVASFVCTDGGTCL